MFPPLPFNVDATSLLPEFVLSFERHEPGYWEPGVDVQIQIPTLYLESGGQDWEGVRDEAHCRWMFDRAAALGLAMYPFGYNPGAYQFKMKESDAAKLLADLVAAGAMIR
jgi:hypothetical protein